MRLSPIVALSCILLALALLIPSSALAKRTRVIEVVCGSPAVDSGLDYEELSWKTPGDFPGNLPKVAGDRHDPNAVVLEFDGPLPAEIFRDCGGEPALFRTSAKKKRLAVRPADAEVKILLRLEENRLIVFKPWAIWTGINQAYSAGQYGRALALIAEAESLGIRLPEEQLDMVRESARLQELRAEGMREFQRGNYDAAADALSQVLEADSGDAGAELTLAKAQYQLGNYGDAEGLFSEIRRREPDNEDAILHLGLVKIGKGLYDDARRFLEEACEKGSIDSYFYLGFVHVQQREVEKARAAFETFIEEGGSEDLLERARQFVRQLGGSAR